MRAGTGGREAGEGHGRTGWRRLVAAVAVAGWMAAGCAAPAAPRPVVRAGMPLPDAAVTDLEGRWVRLASFRGAPLVVNVWATWCLPCREEVPLLDAAFAAHPDIRFAAVDVTPGELRPQDVPAFVRAHGVRYPVYLDPRGSATAALGVAAIPTTLFVDPGGVVRRVVVGPLEADTLRAGLAAIQSGTATETAIPRDAQGGG